MLDLKLAKKIEGKEEEKWCTHSSLVINSVSILGDELSIGLHVSLWVESSRMEAKEGQLVELGSNEDESKKGGRTNLLEVISELVHVLVVREESLSLGTCEKERRAKREARRKKSQPSRRSSSSRPFFLPSPPPILSNRRKTTHRRNHCTKFPPAPKSPASSPREERS